MKEHAFRFSFYFHFLLSYGFHMHNYTCFSYAQVIMYSWFFLELCVESQYMKRKGMLSQAL